MIKQVIRILRRTISFDAASAEEVITYSVSVHTRTRSDDEDFPGNDKKQRRITRVLLLLLLFSLSFSYRYFEFVRRSYRNTVIPTLFLGPSKYLFRNVVDKRRTRAVYKILPEIPSCSVHPLIRPHLVSLGTTNF